MANGTLKVGTLTTSSGSGNITIGSGVTLNSNTPAFRAVLSANQTLTENAQVLGAFDEEVFDTNNAYNNTSSGNGYAFTVPAGHAGKYMFYSLTSTNSSASTVEFIQASFYINGTRVTNNYIDLQNNEGGALSGSTSIVFDLNVGDYVQQYFRVGLNSGTPDLYAGSGDRKDSWFGAYRIGA